MDERRDRDVTMRPGRGSDRFRDRRGDGARGYGPKSGGKASFTPPGRSSAASAAPRRSCRTSRPSPTSHSSRATGRSGFVRWARRGARLGTVHRLGGGWSARRLRSGLRDSTPGRSSPRPAACAASRERFCWAASSGAGSTPGWLQTPRVARFRSFFGGRGAREQARSSCCRRPLAGSTSRPGSRATSPTRAPGNAARV